MEKRILLLSEDQDLILEVQKNFANSAKKFELQITANLSQAIKTIQNFNIQVVALDLDISSKDALTVLEKVKRLCPGSVRVAIYDSWRIDHGAISSTAHQILKKPLDGGYFMNMLERSFHLRRLLGQEALQNMVAEIGTLPSLSTTYKRLMQEIRSPTASMREIGKIISKDMAMSAKILQMVNSPFFGLVRSVTKPEQAVHLLGLEVVRALALSIHIFQKFEGGRSVSEYLHSLFEHSLQTAILAKEIAKAEELEPLEADNTFLAGLLHDTGKLILASNLSEKYMKLVKRARKDLIPQYQVDKEEFGCTHAEIGGYLLCLWGLPETVVEAVSFSHFPEKNLGIDFSTLTAVYAADVLVNQFKRVPMLAGNKEFNPEILQGISSAEEKFARWKEIAERIFT